MDNKNNANHQEKIIEKALRTSGFLFPKTVEEIKEYERIYGTTDVILPPELQSLTFLDSNTKCRSIVKTLPVENFAMAAREASNSLSEKERKKIINDIKASEKKKNKK